jgi:hypothetical protein
LRKSDKRTDTFRQHIETTARQFAQEKWTYTSSLGILLVILHFLSSSSSSLPPIAAAAVPV